MALKFVVLLLLASVGVFTEKVKVTVYYETHCPCSITFIKRQLYPNYFKLSEHINVELIPYGNTKRILENGVVDFECKKDCRALRVHACAVAVPNPMNATLHFLNCMIDGQYTDNDIVNCAVNFSINGNTIQDCLSSNTSTVLLDQFGNRTQEVLSAHIPAISFNDQYDDDVSQKARENFLEAICPVFKVEVPNICLSYNQSLAANAI